MGFYRDPPHTKDAGNMTDRNAHDERVTNHQSVTDGNLISFIHSISERVVKVGLAQLGIPLTSALMVGAAVLANAWKDLSDPDLEAIAV